MNAWLNYHHLFYFKTIAAEGSIAKAAVKLRLGQPTLSSQLKQFEESLGVQLFERQHKKLTLNETGRMVYKYASHIFSLGNELQQVLSDQLPSAKTHLQIGVLDGIPKPLIAKVVSSALAVAPCMVSILEGKGDDLLHDLSLYKFDLVLTNYAPFSDGEAEWFSRRIARMPVILCGAPKFKALKKGFPQSLVNAPVVMPTGHSKLRGDLEYYFSTNNVSYSLVAETQDTALQMLLGINGDGIIPIPQGAAEHFLASGELIEIGRLPNVFDELFLVTTKRKIEHPIATHLMKNFKL